MASERLAVVVGINEYEDAENIKALRGAVRDAQEVRDSLQGAGGGFKILHYLENKGATCEAIRRALYDLFWKSCDTCELALFYFSGHGIQDGHRESYLAPCDVNCKELLVKGIKMMELKQILRGAKNRTNAVMILDCCHSGVVAIGDERDVAVAKAKHPLFDAMREGEKKPGEEKPEPATGRTTGGGKFILASAGPHDPAREKLFTHVIRKEGETEHYHGLFTFHMLEGMNGLAANPDNEVYLAGLQNHISKCMAIIPTTSLTTGALAKDMRRSA